jgi:hypothetical protein
VLICLCRSQERQSIVQSGMDLDSSHGLVAGMKLLKTYFDFQSKLKAYKTKRTAQQQKQILYRSLAEELLGFLLSAISVTKDASSSLHLGQSTEEALARTLICDNNLSTCSAFGLRACVEHQNNIVQNKPMFLRRFRRHLIMRWLWVRSWGGRVVCRTEEGYIGMVPSSTQVGDTICAFLGTDTPFVIHDRGEGNWQLIGECYIHSMMDTLWYLRISRYSKL